MLKSQNSIPIQCTSCRKFIFSFYKGFHWGQYCNSDLYTCGLNIVNSQKAFCKILLIIFFYQSQMCKKNPHICRITYLKEGARLSWSWSYASWIYNYLCNQCLSSMKLWVQISLRRGVLDTTLCDKVCQWLATGRWFSSGTTVSSINKTDHHDITEILLEVALNTITLALFIRVNSLKFSFKN